MACAWLRQPAGLAALIPSMATTRGWESRRLNRRGDLGTLRVDGSPRRFRSIERVKMTLKRQTTVPTQNAFFSFVGDPLKTVAATTGRVIRRLGLKKIVRHSPR